MVCSCVKIECQEVCAVMFQRMQKLFVAVFLMIGVVVGHVGAQPGVEVGQKRLAHRFSQLAQGLMSAQTTTSRNSHSDSSKPTAKS